VPAHLWAQDLLHADTHLWLCRVSYRLFVGRIFAVCRQVSLTNQSVQPAKKRVAQHRRRWKIYYFTSIVFLVSSRRLNSSRTNACFLQHITRTGQVEMPEHGVWMSVVACLINSEVEWYYEPTPLKEECVWKQFHFQLRI
jgi:hypothetical protein